ncbi:MAG: hypothetical protein AAB573_00050 [Patescibacteria group bacterium]
MSVELAAWYRSRRKEERRRFGKALYDHVEAWDKFRVPQSYEELEERRNTVKKERKAIEEDLVMKRVETFRSETHFLKWRRKARTAKALYETELRFLNLAERLMTIERAYGEGALNFFDVAQKA